MSQKPAEFDKLPADAVPLREAKLNLARPGLVEAYRKLVNERGPRVPNTRAQRTAILRSMSREERRARWLHGELLPRQRARRRPKDVRDVEIAKAKQAVSQAFYQMLKDGELVALAQERPPRGPWCAIPAEAWRKIRVTSLAKGTITGPGYTLTNVHVVEARKIVDSRSFRHDGSGRPTYMHLIVQELERRAESSELADTLSQEADALLEFYALKYPKLPPYKKKTITNKIRAIYRKHRPSNDRTRS